MFLYIFKIIIKLIMMSSWFDLGSTSKTLNLFLLWFNEWFGSENLAYVANKIEKLHRDFLWGGSNFHLVGWDKFARLLPMVAWG